VKNARSLPGRARPSLIDDDQPRLAEQRSSDAETMLHAARKAAATAVSCLEQVGANEEPFDHVAALARAADTFQSRQMIEQVERSDLG
jgi:hypothetical protein